MKALTAILAVILGLVGRGAAEGANIFVTSLADKVSDNGGCSLKEAILSANGDTNFIFTSPTTGFFTGCAAGSGDDTIVLPAGQVISLSRIVDDPDNPFGPTATPMIVTRITIEMNGTRLQWVGSHGARAFAVASTGDLTIRNAYIKDFVARGGNGAYGGGGGLGAGGAIYVKGSGSLTVDSSTFEHNTAFGGLGGGGNAGGGGGMGGNGGTGGDALGGGFFGGGGGGGGSRGNGGAAETPRGGGGGGTLTNGASRGGSGGFRCGAAGADGGIVNTDGDDASCPGGGGGGGGGALFGAVDRPGNGGNGAYGGGGGGGGGTGNGGTDGGSGDFGGGGGAAGGDTSNLLGDGPSGGNGGFGAGGGAGVGGYLPGPLGGGAGHGGLLGGDASHTGGGGGAGLGGAIFNDGGTLTIVNSTFTRNLAEGGTRGANDAVDGLAAGGAIFSVHGSATVVSSTISANETINGNQNLGSAGGLMVLQAPSPQLAPTSFALYNTIVSNNGDDACAVFVLTATVVGSGNLVQKNAGCLGAVTDADPTLSPLQLNGGLTPTMAITGSSPAFDAGDVLPTEHTDQRGARRPQGQGFDIGAFEVCVFDPKQDCFGFHTFQFTRHLDTSAFPTVGGTVSPPSGDYPLDSVQPLTATANAGFSFAGWIGNAGDPTRASTFVAMDQDQVLTANFAGCVINVSGRGTAGTTLTPPRVDLTWAPNGADYANVLRSATSGGPYSFVGVSTTTSFTDTTPGLVNNTKAYYVLQFFASTGVTMCNSSEVAVTIPKGR